MSLQLGYDRVDGLSLNVNTAVTPYQKRGPGS